MELDTAFKKIFSSKNLHENLSKINGEYKENDLVLEVTNFISKDKKRPICTPNCLNNDRFNIWRNAFSKGNFKKSKKREIKYLIIDLTNGKL